MVELLQTSEKAFLESAEKAVDTESTSKFWILQPHSSKLLTFDSFGLPGSFLPDITTY